MYTLKWNKPRTPLQLFFLVRYFTIIYNDTWFGYVFGPLIFNKLTENHAVPINTFYPTDGIVIFNFFKYMMGPFWSYSKVNLRVLLELLRILKQEYKLSGNIVPHGDSSGSPRVIRKKMSVSFPPLVVWLFGPVVTTWRAEAKPNRKGRRQPRRHFMTPAASTEAAESILAIPFQFFSYTPRFVIRVSVGAGTILSP